MWALHTLKHGCHQYLLKEIPICHHCYKWFVLGDRELAIFIAERCPVVSSSVTEMLTASKYCFHNFCAYYGLACSPGLIVLL